MPSCQEMDADDAIVLVQDYHFALAPRLIRERKPRATIITFWHIPWPNFERLGICPCTEQILHGLLGSSILGFHTQFHCNNFFDSVDRFLEARIDREFDAVIYGGVRTLIRPYPISIDWPNRWALSTPAVDQCRREILAELGLPGRHAARRRRRPARLHQGHRGAAARGRAAAAALLAVPRAAGLRAARRAEPLDDSRIPRAAGSAGRSSSSASTTSSASGSYRPIILRRTHHEPPLVFRYLKAAHFVYVSSLHDGMNLVAKEFVAARDDEQGVLVLSSFTGASRELAESLIVNPYDLDEASDALAAALAMPEAEQRVRMRAMRVVRRRIQRLSLGRPHASGCRASAAARASGRPLRGPRRRPARDSKPEAMDL